MKNKDVIKIGCFGALRPLKNHLQQAIWSITFANLIGKQLEFHINKSEFEEEISSPVLKNLRRIFESTPHKLVEHSWLEHDKFLDLVSEMDLGLQLSFTETFNIVSADFVYKNVPIIVSDEISWVNFLFRANPSKRNSVLARMFIAYYGRFIGLQGLNKRGLKKYNQNSTKDWLKYIAKQDKV